MTEKLATRPGMKLAKIGALLMGGALAFFVLGLATGLLAQSPWLVLLSMLAATVGGILVIVGFVKRFFAAIETR